MGTILVVHDELNSLELSVFKKDDRSKPELRYFPNNNDRILKRMTIQSMRGRADWSYWRIDY